VLDQSATIEPAHLHAALALVDYAEASTRWLFGARSGDSIADTILEALRSRGPMTRWEISNLLGRNVAAARIDQALQALQAAELVECEQGEAGPQGGRRRTVWRCRG
jgi:hypothetical protein